MWRIEEIQEFGKRALFLCKHPCARERLKVCMAQFLAYSHRSELMEVLSRTAPTFAVLTCYIWKAATECLVQAPKNRVDRKATLHSALVIVTLLASPWLQGMQNSGLLYRDSIFQPVSPHFINVPQGSQWFLHAFETVKTSHLN